MNSDICLISVIIPVYNVEDYIIPCVNSVICQTYKNIEIILVDDGSKDRSGELCDELSLTDTRIQVIHKSNGGLSDARNVGIKEAKGEYVVFVDGDDVVSDHYIDYLFGLMNKGQADIAICDPVHCYGYDDIQFSDETCKTVFNADEAIVEMLYQKSFLFTAWGKIFPKIFFDDIEFPVGMLYEDVAVMHRLFDKSNKIIYGNAKLYAYIHRENSITTQKFTKKDLDILVICNQICSYFEESRSKELQNAALAYQVNCALRIYLNAPRSNEYFVVIRECSDYIHKNFAIVIKDKNIRNKLKYALYLFIFARPLLMIVYNRIDRWK